MTKQIQPPATQPPPRPCICRTAQDGWTYTNPACSRHSDGENAAWAQNSERKQSHLNRYYSGGR